MDFVIIEKQQKSYRTLRGTPLALPELVQYAGAETAIQLQLLDYPMTENKKTLFNKIKSDNFY